MRQPVKIGKYEVLAELGHGGMGVVYKALDTQLDRLVAIKMIIGATPALLKRFNVEARSTGSLQHPNIVTIYDFGEQDGSPYLVMEFLEGKSLDSVIKSGQALTLFTKLKICVEICNGLHYAHERGIIHRDIKPANVMLLDGGEIKIVDFGIARIGDTGISRTELVGSLNFMSPEQFRGGVLDRRVDIWSTGVLLYQLLTDTLPFSAADDAATMYKILHDEPSPLGNYIQNFPPELTDIISRALAKKRDARYLTTHDLAFDLQAILDQEKHVEASQWLKRAEAAVQKTDWTKAEDCLKQVLRIDKHHTEAHQLLSRVQVQIRSLRKIEQARQLRLQADGAFIEHRYDDALSLIEQAISLDRTSQDLVSLRESIRESKTRAAQFQAALRQAEEAHHAGDLDEARLAVQRALSIDPSETSAKALNAAISRGLEERDKSKKLRVLLDRGREQIAGRDLTGAFTTLKQAETLDPASAELFSLLKVLHGAREEQVRQVESEAFSRQIDDCLKREDYAGAVAIANQALARYPQDKGLQQFKYLAEAEHGRAIQKIYAKEQFLAARMLLDEGRNSDAISVIENALRTVPNDFELDSLRRLANSRLAAAQSDQRKTQSIARAGDLAAAGKLEDALRILGDLRREFEASEDVESLLRTVLAARERTETVGRICVQAQQMLANGRPDLAVQLLEANVLETSDPRLFDALESARRSLQRLDSKAPSGAESKNQRMLREGGLHPPESQDALHHEQHPLERETLKAATPEQTGSAEDSGADFSGSFQGATSIFGPDRLGTEPLRAPDLSRASETTQFFPSPVSDDEVRRSAHWPWLVGAAAVLLLGFVPIYRWLSPHPTPAPSGEAEVAQSDASTHEEGGTVPVATTPSPVLRPEGAISRPEASTGALTAKLHQNDTKGSKPSTSAVETMKRPVPAAAKDALAIEKTNNLVSPYQPAEKPLTPADSNRTTTPPPSTQTERESTPTVQVATAVGPSTFPAGSTESTSLPASTTARPSGDYSRPTPSTPPTSAPPASVPPHATEATNVPSLLTSEKNSINTALEQYKEAYESESMDELLKIWPSISKDQKKALKAGFESAQAIRISLACGDPIVSGDVATVKCNQSLKYTHAGKVEAPQTASIEIALKKKQAVWLVNGVRAN